ncbi:hypothetical protein Tco_1337071 [Tanacetum coccineum]
MQSHNITVKRKKQSTPSILPPKDDQERDKIAERRRLKDIDCDKDQESMQIEKEKKDDKVIEKEKKDEEIEKVKNNDIVEETDKVVKEKDIVDDVTSSMEIRKEQKKTQFPHQLDPLGMFHLLIK